MKKHAIKFLFFLSLLSTTHALADGQSVPINYDDISFFEEPLAISLGPATLNANAIIDQAAQYNSQADEDEYNTFIAGNFKLETELPNSWQLGVQYFSRYDRLIDDKYSDNFAVFLSDEWGIISLGNVTRSVTENVRRDRGVGNAVLGNNNFLGQLDETGAYYAVDFNSYNFSITSDQDGRTEAGLVFEQPRGVNNYVVGTRLRYGNLSENNAFDTHADTFGGTLIGEYLHGSLQYDAQIGYELIDFDLNNNNNEHVFGALGARYQYGAYNFSLEGGLGRYNGFNRRAFSFGTRFDIARGFSFNTGINYIYAKDHDEITTVGSIRYEL